MTDVVKDMETDDSIEAAMREPLLVCLSMDSCKLEVSV